MHHVLMVALTCAIAFAAQARTVTAEPGLPSYRGMTLGDPLQIVLAKLQIPEADVKAVHDDPMPIQRITWRPRPYVSGTPGEAESVAEMMLTFYAGRLAQIAVTYDRARTHGLTDADMLEALAGPYGAPLLVSTPTQAAVTPPGAQVSIGQWEDGDTRVILWREQFPNRVGLVITSKGSQAALEQAIADGMRLETAAAPARELARRTAEAETIRARDEKIRLENKAKFKP
jgi:hypothetical protein